MKLSCSSLAILTTICLSIFIESEAIQCHLCETESTNKPPEDQSSTSEPSQSSNESPLLNGTTSIDRELNYQQSFFRSTQNLPPCDHPQIIHCKSYNVMGLKEDVCITIKVQNNTRYEFRKCAVNKYARSFCDAEKGKYDCRFYAECDDRHNCIVHNGCATAFGDEYKKLIALVCFVEIVSWLFTK